jgi:hypothetical protein
MKRKIQYNSDSERITIIEENSALILVEEHNIYDGNFLIFSNIPLEKEIIYTQVPQEDFNRQKTDLIEIQDVIFNAIMEGKL